MQQRPFDENNRAYLTEHSRDKDGYLAADMPEGATISANHSHIFIDGDIQKDANVSVRQGIVSARSLGENAEVTGGILLILSDDSLSRKSMNLRHASADYPAILVVPEAERARVFDCITAKNKHYAHYPPTRELQELLAENPTLPFKLIPGNAQDAKALQDAGLGGRGL